METSFIPWLALAGRIILLGFERIVVKRMGGTGDAFAATFLFFAIGAAVLVPLLPFDAGLDAWKATLPGFGSGLFYAVAFACYVKSLSLGEASLVSPLYNSNVFFLAFIAFIFLGEPLNIAKIAGLAFLLYGASMLGSGSSIFESLKALGKDTACRYMVTASLLIACGRVVDAKVVSPDGGAASPIIFCFALYTIIAIYVLIITAVRGKLGDIAKIFRTDWVSSTLAGAINGYSYYLLLVAMTGIQVSVAEPASMLSVLVTMLLARRTFKENLGKRPIAALIMIVGAVFIIQ